MTGALRKAERALALEEKLAHPQFFGIAHAMRGWALATTGREEEGIAELQRALADELRASTIWAAMIGTMLAEIHLDQGRPSAARSLLDQVQLLTVSMPAYYCHPEIHRIEAEWLTTNRRFAEARSRLCESVRIARQHGSWALAVRSALALVNADSTDREADLQLLRDVAQQVPEDNDTDDGRNAKALINGTSSRTGRSAGTDQIAPG